MARALGNKQELQRTQKCAPLTRRGLLKAGLHASAGLALGGAMGAGWSYEVEPTWIELNHLELVLPRLARAFDRYRIVQLSDIHMDHLSEAPSMDSGRLHKVVQLVNFENADLIAFTGDFVTGSGPNAWSYADELVAALGGLRARDGVVAILGNHDHWSDAAALHRVIARCGFANLCNGVFSLRRENDFLHLAGVDDWWVNKSDLHKVLKLLPPDGAAILLAHEPDFADVSARSGRFDLQLSGHSHGGQIDLPVVGAPVLPPLSRRYPRGLYPVQTMWQYTNRGVGTVAPHVRFNCRPEITVFTLRSAL